MVFDGTMGAVWLWARASTRRALGGLVLIAVLAGLSGATVLIGLVGANRTRSALDRAVAADDPGLINLQSQDPTAFAGLDRVPGVRLVLPFETFIGNAAETDAGFVLYMSPRPFGTTVDRIDPARGRLPGNAGEVLLTEQTAAALHLDVGDTFTFASQSWEQLDALNSPSGPTGTEASGPVVSLTVVGIGSTLIQKVQPDAAAGWVSEDFATTYDKKIAHMGGVDGLGSVQFVWVDSEPAIAGVRQALDKVDAPVGFSRFSTFATPARSSTGTMASGVLMFAIAAAVVGLGAIAVAVLRHIARFRRDQTALEALGATRRWRAMLGTVSVAPAAVAAGVVTVVAAIVASRVMPFGAAARRLDPDVGARPSLLILVTTGVAVAALVSGVAFLGALRQAEPRGFRRVSVVSRMIAGPVGRWPTLTTGIGFAVDGRAAKQAGAVRAALVAGALGVAGVVGGATVMNALDDLHSTPPRWGYTWTIMIDDGDTAAADARELLSAPDLNAAVAGWAISTEASATVNGVDVRVDALDVGAGPIAPAIVRGRPPASPDEVVLGGTLADDLNVSIGDSVTATTDGGPIRLTVVGEATLYPVGSGLLRYPAVLLTPAGQARVALDRTFYRIAFLAQQGVSADMLYDRLSAVIGEGGMPSRTDALPSAPSEVRNVVQLKGVALALALFTGVLGLILVANALVVTPRRRARDLAVLKALGTARAQVIGAIGVQAATISLLSIVVGVPVGLIAGRLAFARIAEHAGVGAGSFAAWGVVAVVISALVLLTPVVAAWPAWRAARLRPAAVLRGE